MMIYLFLDYDGTLAPIAGTPDKAKMPGETGRLLRELSASRGCKVAVISGRSLADIRRAVGLRGIVYSGNHGLEMQGPGIRYRNAVVPGFRKTMAKIISGLRRGTGRIKGVILEDKGLTLSVHYRMADKRRIPEVRSLFREAVAEDVAAGRVKVRSGKMMLEVRPPVDWDKGKSVLWLLAKQKAAAGGRPVLPVYLGDDDTDEDAFAALSGRGLTFIVGGAGRSKAGFRLKSQKEVVRLLRLIRDFEKES